MLIIYIYILIYIYIYIRKDYNGQNTWEPASNFDQQLLDEFHAKQEELSRQQQERRKQVLEEAASQRMSQGRQGPSLADRITALAKKYERSGLAYWKAHDKATVDVMSTDSAACK